MPYRENLACQECLKRKEKSPKAPMNAKDAKYLRMVLFAAILCLGIGVVIVVANAFSAYGLASWAVATGVSGGCFLFAFLFIGLGYMGAFD